MGFRIRCFALVTMLALACAGCATPTQAARTRIGGIVLVAGGALAIAAGATAALDCAASADCSLAKNAADRDVTAALIGGGGGLVLMGALLWYASTRPVKHPDVEPEP